MSMNFNKHPRPTPARSGQFLFDGTFMLALMAAIAGENQRLSLLPVQGSYPRTGRSPGDRAHKRWKRQRAGGRAA